MLTGAQNKSRDTTQMLTDTVQFKDGLEAEILSVALGKELGGATLAA